MLSSALNAIEDKYEDSGLSMDKTELVAALIVEAPKNHLRSINTQNDQWEQNVIYVEEIVKGMSDLYQMQKVWNIKLDNNDDDYEVMVTNIDECQGNLLQVPKKGHKKGNFPHKSGRTEDKKTKIK